MILSRKGCNQNRRLNARRRRQRVQHRGLTVEPLESRRLLATIVVDTQFDLVDVANTATISDLPGPDLQVSLREALLAANNTPGIDQIEFDSAAVFADSQTILLDHGQLRIRDSVNLVGPGADRLTIDAQGQSRVVLIGNNSAASRLDVSLSSLTLTGGLTTADGGGIQNAFENLSLTEMQIVGNTAANRGGAIHHQGGDLHIESSTIANNAAAKGGGLWTKLEEADKTTLIVNSTFSGNTASDRGGGIENFLGATTIQNSTITANSAPTGSGIASKGNSSSETRIGSSIIAGNLSSDIDFVAGPLNTFVSLGSNVVGLGTGAANFDNDDQTSIVDPKLEALADNGGPTQTHALLADSPAIDSGDNNLGLSFDQRGTPFVRSSGADSDAGAFELQGLTGPLVVDIAVDESDGNFSPGDLSLREAIELANSNPGVDEIMFDTAGVFATQRTIALQFGTLLISDDVNVTGPGATQLTIVGQPGADLLMIEDGDPRSNIDVSIAGLTLTGAGRAAINSMENLRVRDSLITGNTLWGILSDSSGLNDFFRRNKLAVINSTIENNTDGVQTYESYVNITNSRISGNSNYGLYANEGKVSVNVSTISANRGGGIYANSPDLEDGFVKVQGSRIINNTARRGGIWVSQSLDLQIIDSEVSGNVSTSLNGGGVFAQQESSVRIERSTIAANTAIGPGGGVSAFDSTVSIVDSDITHNIADRHGGGVFVDGGGSLSIAGTTLTDNLTYGSGGGIFTAVEAEITGSIISRNDTQPESDFFATSSGDGGGIYAASDLTISNSQITGNATANGRDGDYPRLNAGTSGNGGGVFVAGALNLNSTSVANNSTGHGGAGYWGVGETAGSGGGIYAIGPVVANNLTLTGNSTGSGGDGGWIFERGRPISGRPDGGHAGSGGGLFAKGSVSIADSSVTGNQTGDGGLGYARFGEGAGDGGRGGGVYAGGALQLVDSVVTGNGTGDGGQGSFYEYCPVPDVYCYIYLDRNGRGGDGGGVFAAASATIVGSTINDNLTGGGDTGGNGGGIWVRDSLQLSHSELSGNITGVGGQSPYAQYRDGPGGSGGAFFAQHATVSDANLVENIASSGGEGGGFYVHSTSLTNSNISSNDAARGGGILIATSGTITNSALTDNSASEGGGIYSVGEAVVIVSADVSRNTADRDGGGIFLSDNGVPVTENRIDDSNIRENTAGERGGGIAWIGGDGSQSSLEIVDSHLEQNSALFGGGIYATGTTALERTDVAHNATRLVPSDFPFASDSGSGGGIYTTGTMSIAESVVTGNSTADGQDGEYGANCNFYYCDFFYYPGGDAGDGGGIYNAGNLTIAASVIYANQTGAGGAGGTVGGGDGGNGGGVFSAAGAMLTLNNSTLSGNTAGEGGEGLASLHCDYVPPYSNNCVFTYSPPAPDGNDGAGGGLWSAGTTNINNSTITQNRAYEGSGVASLGDMATSTTLSNTIVYENDGSDVDLVDGPANSLLSNGYNLIGTGNSLGSFNNNDLTGVTGQVLLPLADYGGETLTHALSSGSPAIDAGDPGFGTPPEFDQRGSPFHRVAGGRVDIGAFEVQVTVPDDVVDFSRATITPYGNQDGASTVTVEDGGSTLRIVGNAWKKIDFDYLITPATVLEFDFQSATQGEIHGIGLDDNNGISAVRTFRLYGTQTFGNDAFADYSGTAPAVRHYRIPVGDFYSGPASYLFFVNDHDRQPQSGESVFSNVRIYEDAGMLAPATVFAMEPPNTVIESETAVSLSVTRHARLVRDTALAIGSPALLQEDDLRLLAANAIVGRSNRTADQSANTIDDALAEDEEPDDDVSAAALEHFAV